MANHHTLKTRSVEQITLRQGEVTLTVAAKGAEPQSLTTTDGTDYLWDGHTAWYRRAPFLFPVICRVPDDQIVVDGQAYPMKQHGIARDRSFSLVDHSRAHARFELYADSVTRESFPYEFTLAITHRVHDDGMSVEIEVHNRGDVPMPYSVGWHPAFRWPLGDVATSAGHRVEFDQPEPGPVRRVVNNLLSPVEQAPIAADGVVDLRRSDFADGAIILRDVVSDAITYAAPSGRSVRIVAGGFTGWTLWTADGGDFICLEPWAGSPAPVDFSGEFAEHPGVQSLAPGAVSTRTVRLTLG